MFDWPTWAWVLAAAVVWYPLAGVAIRRLAADEGAEIEDFAAAWVLSPVIAAAFVVCFTVATAAWLVTGGLAPRPW